MAYQVEVVAVAATGTLIWQTSTGVSPDPAIAPASAVYPAGTATTPRPIAVIVPSGSTLVPVSAVGGTPLAGAAGWVGPATVPFNQVGNSQFVGAISGTGSVTVVVDY
jgi:hypothetical protein